MNGMPMDEDFLALLEELPPEQLASMFFPYQQEQGGLDQQMALAQQLRQRGPGRSSPTGALLGGLSNAVGNVGGAVLQKKGLGEQRALGGRMQQDATDRMGILADLLRRRSAFRGAGATAAGGVEGSPFLGAGIGASLGGG